MLNTYNIDSFITACESNIIFTPAMEGERFNNMVKSIGAFIDRIILFIKEIQIKIAERHDRNADFVFDYKSARISELQQCHRNVIHVLDVIIDPRTNKYPQQTDDMIKKTTEVLDAIKFSIQKPVNGKNIVTIRANEVTTMIKDINTAIKTVKDRIKTFEKARIGYVENHGHTGEVDSTVNNCRIGLKLCMDELSTLMTIVKIGTVAVNAAQ